MPPVPEVENAYRNALKLYQTAPAEALQILKQILEKEPGFEDAYEALSVILYNQKNYDEAIQILKAWVRLNPNSIMSHTNLSRCYVAKGMILEAEKEQAEARRLTWMEELKSKKQAVPDRNWQAEVERYQQVITFDPKDVLGYFSLGRVYLDWGKKREAIDTFRKGLDADPDHSASYLGLGEALEGLGDPKGALQVYEKGILIAQRHGDLMTQKKMEARSKAILTNP